MRIMFQICITTTLILASYSSLLAKPCDISSNFENATVNKIIDGDTVELADKSRVRLIGINTPEKSRRFRGQTKPAEPHANDARNFLVQLLKKHQFKVQIINGQQAKDKYGRRLAHLFVNNKTNVQAELLRQGWAMNLAFSPNLKYQACYLQVQKSARKAKRGLWSNQYYQAIEADKLSASIRTGFRLITGKVASVKYSPRSIWINFRGYKLAAKVSRNDISLFSRKQILNLKNKQIKVMGYLIKRQRPHRKYGAFIVLLKHPDMILP